jgi:hypothetical protein
MEELDRLIGEYKRLFELLKGKTAKERRNTYDEIERTRTRIVDTFIPIYDTLRGTNKVNKLLEKIPEDIKDYAIAFRGFKPEAYVFIPSGDVKADTNRPTKGGRTRRQKYKTTKKARRTRRSIIRRN